MWSTFKFLDPYISQALLKLETPVHVVCVVHSMQLSPNYIGFLLLLCTLSSRHRGKLISMGATPVAYRLILIIVNVRIANGPIRSSSPSKTESSSGSDISRESGVLADSWSRDVDDRTLLCVVGRLDAIVPRSASNSLPPASLVVVSLV